MPSATWLREVEAAQRVFKVKESEHTWQSFDTTLLKLQQLINSLVTQDLSPALIVAGLKDLRVPLNACILSERTKLSGSALELLAITARTLRTDFEPLFDVYLGAMLKCTGRANRVFVVRASTCLTDMMRLVLPFKALAKLLDVFSESAVKSTRIAIASAMLALLQALDDMAGLSTPNKDLLLDAWTRFLALGLNDAVAEVRGSASQAFHLLQEHFPLTAQQFLADASPQMLKTLKLKTTLVPPTSSVPPLRRTATPSASAGRLGGVGASVKRPIAVKSTSVRPAQTPAARSGSLGCVSSRSASAELGEARSKTDNGDNETQPSLGSGSGLPSRTPTPELVDQPTSLDPSRNNNSTSPRRPKRIMSVPSGDPLATPRVLGSAARIMKPETQKDPSSVVSMEPVKSKATSIE